MNRNAPSLSHPGRGPAGPGLASSPAAAATGALTIFMTLLGWSAVPLFIKHFAESIDVWTSNGWRYGFSALLWAPVLVIAWRRRRLPERLWRASLIPATFNALGQVAFAWSFYKIDPTTATFGLRMQIVFVAVGAYLLFPVERALLRRPLTWISIVLVLSGVMGTIVLSPGAREQGAAAPHAFGVALAIASGLLFAGYALSVRRCMHGFHPVTAFAAISQYTALAMVVLMVVLARDPETGSADFGAAALALPAGQFGLLLLSAVIGIALGHVFYYIAIARLGVAVSSGVVQLQPFCVAVGSYFIFGQAMTSGQLVAGVIAVAGAMMLLTAQYQLSRRTRAGTTDRVLASDREESPELAAVQSD